MEKDNFRNRSDNPDENRRFRPREDLNGERRQAVRQVETGVVVQRPVNEKERPFTGQRETPKRVTPKRETPNGQSAPGRRPDAPVSSGSSAQTTGERRATSHASSGYAGQSKRPRQVVVEKPKTENPADKKQPVVIDSPDIDSQKTKIRKRSNKKPVDKQRPDEERKFYFQKFSEISLLRRMLMLVFGLLFMWCLAPAFFHIVSIGVISSSAVMLSVVLVAMFWHLIDRNWTFKKALVCLLAAAVFTACVAGFGIVSGMMLKASLTAAPSGSTDCTVVILGCKAHGDQPSWMLNDRLEKAYAVLRENPGFKCVVTGGMGDDEQYTEAYVMKKYLTEKGISSERIYMEELAESTEENLLYTKNLIRLNGLSENIVVVTDRFHELRARIWAEKSGFKNIYSACCETRIYLVTGYWFREMFGLARLYVFGR